MEMIMSTMTRVPAAAPDIPGSSASRWLGSALKRWWLARMERRLESLAVRQLHAMSDRELRDIGIMRSQIGFVVRRDREGDRVLLHF
jgi:uncharacterized protein YjiS (DUF1127 family)